MNPELSLVIPIRNESPNIEALYNEMTEALERLRRSYEVLAIDDGSTDDSFDRLARCQQRDPRWRSFVSGEISDRPRRLQPGSDTLAAV